MRHLNKLEKAIVRLIINPYLEENGIDPKEANVEIHFKNDIRSLWVYSIGKQKQL